MTITEEQLAYINKRLQSNEIEQIRNFLSLDSKYDDIPSDMCLCDRAPGSSHFVKPKPHFKSEYCFENDNRETTPIKTSKKSDSAQKVINLNTVPTKNSVSSPNNFSFNIPKEFQGKSNPVLGTKQKSIFSFTRPPYRTSSVIIEELPNEPSNNKDANVRVKPNETFANKNVKITDKSQTIDDEQVKVPNAKILNENNEQSSNSNGECNKISREKVKVADKYKNKTRKPEKYIPNV